MNVSLKLGTVGVVVFALFILVTAFFGVIYGTFALGDHPAWYDYFPLVFTGLLALYLGVTVALLALGRGVASELATTGTFALHTVFFVYVLFRTLPSLTLSSSPNFYLSVLVELLVIVAIAVLGLAAVVGRSIGALWAFRVGIAVSILLILTFTGAAAGGIALYVLGTSLRPSSRPVPVPISPVP